MALDFEEPVSDFYDVLGVSKDCSDEDIRSAYKKLAKKWHPDKWSSVPSFMEEAKLKFQKIQEAYSVLSDGNKRSLYDVGLYEPDDDVDGMSDFLNEMAVMMAKVRDQSNNEQESFEDLQEAFAKLVNDNCWVYDNDLDFASSNEKEYHEKQFDIHDFIREEDQKECDYWYQDYCSDPSYYALQDCDKMLRRDFREIISW